MAYYNLIFQGKIIDGASLDEVKSNIAQLFKVDAAKTATLFSGKTIVIKKNLTIESAKIYLSVLKKAGAVVTAVKIEDPSSDHEPVDLNSKGKVDTDSSQKQTLNSTTEIPSEGLSSGLAALVNYNQTQATPPKTDSLQLAPANSGPLTPEKPMEPINIPDISHLSMSEAQTGILTEFAPPIEMFELPDIDNLTMSEANTGSLEEFVIKPEPAELPDISQLDIAEQDNTPLSGQSYKTEAIEIPDISGLSISEAQRGTLQGIEIKADPVKIPDTSHLTFERLEEKQLSSKKAIFKID